MPGKEIFPGREKFMFCRDRSTHNVARIRRERIPMCGPNELLLDLYDLRLGGIYLPHIHCYQ
jgi:hypothetical protein